MYVLLHNLGLLDRSFIVIWQINRFQLEVLNRRETLIRERLIRLFLHIHRNGLFVKEESSSGIRRRNVGQDVNRNLHTRVSILGTVLHVHVVKMIRDVMVLKTDLQFDFKPIDRSRPDDVSVGLRLL